MRLLIAASALALAACGSEPVLKEPMDQASPSKSPAEPTVPTGPSPVEVVEAFYARAGSAGPSSVQDDFLAADVLAALAARRPDRPVHDYRFNLTLPEEAREAVVGGSRRFVRQDAPEDAPQVAVTGDGIGSRIVFTLCPRGDGWRIAEVEETGHWTLRGDLGLSEAVASDC